MKKNTKQKYTFVIACLVVPVILLCLFVLYPMYNLLEMSFTDWDGVEVKKNFIGIKNYTDMLFNSPDVWLALRNNAIYFFTSLLFVPLEILLAVMFSSAFTGKKFFRGITFLPYILNSVAIGYAFAYFLSPLNGGLNNALKLVGLEGFIQNWLSDEKIVNFVLALIVVWRFSGYHIIIFIAALTSVSKDLTEAAAIDGANAWQIFRHIQVPSISLVIDFILFTNVVGSLQSFDIPFVMTGGGPDGATKTFTLHTLDTAFTYDDFGMAATMAIMMIVLIVLVYSVQNFIVKKCRGEK